jgi:hypothetical protein
MDFHIFLNKITFTILMGKSPANAPFPGDRYRPHETGTRMDGSVRCGEETVFVADGNEETWGISRRFGFSPRIMMLEQRSG